jgi:hypothetical protein
MKEYVLPSLSLVIVSVPCFVTLYSLSLLACNGIIYLACTTSLTPLPKVNS